MPIKKENTNKVELTFKILKAVGLTGTIAAIILLPGLAAAVAPFVQGPTIKRRERLARQRINATAWRLKQRGFLKDVNGKLSLTPKGKALLSRYQSQKITIKKPKRWDGKWRIIAFDIWESRRLKRDILRRTLRNFGFIKLQASLWIYPYDCEEVIGLLRTDLKVFPAIQYMVVEKIDNDAWLRKHFNLSN